MWLPASAQRPRFRALVLVVATIGVVAVGACSDEGAQGGAGASAPLTTVTTTPSCATVDGLVEARYLVEALAALARSQQCDRNGATRRQLEDARGRIDAHLADATAAAERKDTDAQRKALIAAVTLDASDPRMKDQLAALDQAAPKAKPNPFDVAESLDEAGYRKETETVVVEALKKGDSLPKEDADDLDNIRSSWQWLEDNLLRIAAGLVLLLLAASEFVRRSYRRKHQTPIWVRTRIEFSSGVGVDAPAMAALTRANLAAISQECGIPPLAIASVPEGAVNLPELADIDERLKGVGALLAWALRRDKLTIVPTLTSPAKDGAQSRLAVLEFFDDVEGHSTRWTIDEVSDPSLQLSMAAGHAAGWLAIMAPRLRDKFDSEARRATLGTESADSLSAFLAGVEAYDGGEMSVAHGLFEDALAADPGHLRAKHNRAVTVGGQGNVNALAFAAGDLLRLVGRTG